MNEIVENILLILFGAGSGTGIAIWVFKNRNVLLAIAAWFYRTFSWISKKFEYGNIAYNIESTINSVGGLFDQSAPDIMPYPMKISWAKTSDELDTSLRNGEIIVTMQYSANRERNLVISTLAYLRKGLLPRARSYVDKTLMKATDFTVAKEVFNKSSLDMAIPYFYDHFLEEASEEYPTLHEYLSILDKINDADFFDKIFLREIKHMGDKVFPALPNQKIRDESKGFAEFLEIIAEKEKGVDVPGGLMFAGSRIRTSLMLVARSWTRIIGVKPYLKRIEIDLNRGVEHMYVLARSERNIELAEEVIRQAIDLGKLRVLDKYKYRQVVSNSEQPATCIVCALNLINRPSKDQAPSELILEVMKENIQEFCDSKIEVVAATRYPGYKSKIAVRSVYKGLDAMECCTEPERISAIETALGETVEFIPWVNDPVDLILASLTPLSNEMVVDIELDVDESKVCVKVDGWKSKRKALGKGNINLRLASDLTSWHIQIVDISEEKKEIDD
jgi:transcription antitermination factor NusA-like protein